MCESESESQSFSHVQLFATPWTVAYQAPLSMGILQARILEWVAIPFPSPGDLLDLGIEPRHIAGRFFTVGANKGVWKIFAFNFKV